MSWIDILLCFLTPVVVLIALRFCPEEPRNEEGDAERERDPGDMARAA